MVKLYPVPSQGDVNVLSMENAPVTVRVMDMSGRELWIAQVLENAVIPAATWNSGVYLVTVQDLAGKTTTLRLIKE